MDTMKKVICLCLCLCFVGLTFVGCSGDHGKSEQMHTVVATTYPLYYLASEICSGVSEITVQALVQEPVSCLHDYSITTAQMKTLDRAEVVIMNGAGLEGFLESALRYVPESARVDTTAELELLPGEEGDDPHVWLSPMLYACQGDRIVEALSERYPDFAKQFSVNGREIRQRLEALQEELSEELQGITCRDLITFHDGFSYFAQAFNLRILAAVEEEEGAETPAGELREICELVSTSKLPAIFAEKNGSGNAVSIIAQETGVSVYILNTMMDGKTDYFTAMRENVHSVREALS